MLEENTKIWKTILIAGLSALATGLANFVIEELKEHRKKKKKNEKKDIVG